MTSSAPKGLETLAPLVAPVMLIDGSFFSLKGSIPDKGNPLVIVGFSKHTTNIKVARIKKFLANFFRPGGKHYS